MSKIEKEDSQESSRTNDLLHQLPNKWRFFTKVSNFFQFQLVLKNHASVARDHVCLYYQKTPYSLFLLTISFWIFLVFTLDGKWKDIFSMGQNIACIFNIWCWVPTVLSGWVKGKCFREQFQNLNNWKFESSNR